MTTAESTEDLFDTAAFPHFERFLSLFRPAGSIVYRRAVVTVCVGWLPILILVCVDNLRNHTPVQSFVTDFGVHARSLLAAPLLILCEIPCLKRLTEIVNYFLTSGIIGKEEEPRFRRLVVSTRRLINSKVAEVLAVVLAYAVTLLLVRYIQYVQVRLWYLADNSEGDPSWAGWWYALVSLPLLLIIFFSWIWRVFLWGRFLAKVARMKLRLIAAHPDRTSGLKFLNSSLFAFSSVAFSIGVVAAGSAASRVQVVGVTLEGIEKTIAGLLIFVLVLFVGPLLAFVFKLHRTKMVGVFAYGGLATGVGRSFEKKWLANYEKYSSGALEASDFSATTDLYQIVTNVHEMRILPFDLSGLISLAVATLLPFIPVVLMTIPLKQLLQELLRFLV